jgi:hypothetical protein
VSCPTTPPTGTGAGTAGDLPIINLAGAFVIYAGCVRSPLNTPSYRNRTRAHNPASPHSPLALHPSHPIDHAPTPSTE